MSSAEPGVFGAECPHGGGPPINPYFAAASIGVGAGKDVAMTATRARKGKGVFGGKGIGWKGIGGRGKNGPRWSNRAYGIILDSVDEYIGSNRLVL